MPTAFHPTSTTIDDFAYQVFKQEFIYRYYVQDEPNSTFQPTSKKWLDDRFTIYQNSHPHARWFDLQDPTTIQEILDTKRHEYEKLFYQLHPDVLNVQLNPEHPQIQPNFPIDDPNFDSHPTEATPLWD